MLDGLMQFGIAVFGIVSLILIAKNNKWGFIHGLISEFFTIIYSIVNPQVGIFMLSMVQSVVWIYGIYKIFYLNEKINF